MRVTSPPLAGETSGSAPASAPLLDTAEALANATVGFLVSWAATLFVLGYSPAQSLAITAMFFCLSFGRAFILRRLFRWLS